MQAEASERAAPTPNCDWAPLGHRLTRLAVGDGIGEARLRHQVADKELVVALDAGIEHGNGLARACRVQRIGGRHADQRHAVDEVRPQDAVVVDAGYARVVGERLQLRRRYVDGKSRRDLEAGKPAVEALTLRRAGGAAEMPGDDGIPGRRHLRLGIGDTGRVRLELASRNGRVEHHDDAHVPILLRDGGDLGRFRGLSPQGVGLRQSVRRQPQREQHSKRCACHIVKTARNHDFPPTSTSVQSNAPTYRVIAACGTRSGSEFSVPDAEPVPALAFPVAHDERKLDGAISPKEATGGKNATVMRNLRCRTTCGQCRKSAHDVF